MTNKTPLCKSPSGPKREQPIANRAAVSVAAKPATPAPAPAAPSRGAEQNLDALLAAMHEQSQRPQSQPASPLDPIQSLRDQVLRELIPEFEELVEKYTRNGVSMQLDASNLLDGGREIKFEFAVGPHRSQLDGTVTSDAIAFHEVRYAPDIQGQLLAGPMLRLRLLNRDTFREFVCERLALVLKQASKRR